MSQDPYDLEEQLSGKVIPAGDSHLRADATISMDPAGVRAVTDRDEVYLVPWRGIRLGRADGSVTVQAADRSVAITSGHPSFLRALETAGGNDINDAISRLSGERVSSPWKHRLGCLAVLAAIAFVIWAVPQLFRSAVDATVDALPYSVDETIGETVWEGMDLEGPVVEDEVVLAAIQEIIDRLQPFADIPEAEFTFAVVEKDIANAFALPGGYMVVYTGLILRSDSPEQVAGVMAHEMAHVTHRHGLRRIAHSVGIWASISIFFGNLDALSSLALDLFQVATVNGYSQDQETDADLEGCQMLIAAKIDPRGMADFFRLMQEEYGDVPDALAWTSTHPQHEERIAAILAYEKKHGADVEYEPLDIDWDAVHTALGKDDE